MEKQLFIINLPESLDPKMDTSIGMMKALLAQGQQVAWTTIQDMFWDIRANVAKAKIFWSSSADLVGRHNPETLSLDVFDGLHMRQEPPVDHLFSYGLWLLQTLPSSKKIFNSPRSLLEFNEKLITFKYADHCMDSFVTCDYTTAMAYMKSTNHQMFVVKPLDSFGGRGVFKVNIDSEEGLGEFDESFADSSVPRMIQPFNLDISQGELRVFTVMGEDIAWCLKKPKEGSFLANTGHGAKLHDVIEPNLNVARAVKEVAQDLLKAGVYICGFDVLGGKISEINITSPRLLSVGDQNSEAAYQKFAKIILKS